MELVEENIKQHDEDELKYYEFANISRSIKYITDEGKNIDVIFKKYLDRTVNRDDKVIQLFDVVQDIDTTYLIEAGIYEYSLIYSVANSFSISMINPIYEDKFRNILYELKRKDVNEFLLDKIKQNLIEPQELAFLDPQNINPENWNILVRKRKLIEYKKNNMAATDLYKCYKCGERRCQLRQVQTRGADEPMTLFITCLVCYNEFKK